MFPCIPRRQRRAEGTNQLLQYYMSCHLMQRTFTSACDLDLKPLLADTGMVCAWQHTTHDATWQ